ncbi:HD-GYP domain-containing protein [Bacillota bacterium LX-D]|nr:HD-GYP domain-containing protein [Bacillota bacterium LX-D]
MRKVDIDLLTTKMKIAQNVYSSEGYTLLSAGVVLSEQFINKLRYFKVPAVYIEDGFLPEVQVNDLVSGRTRLESKKAVKEITNEVKTQLKNKRGFNINVPKLLSSVKRITEELGSSKNLIVNMTDIRTTDDYTYSHCVNVCVLSLLLGVSLNLTEANLNLLGIGALMHDIGKVMIPEDILNKPGKLTDVEYELMKKHTTFGYEILSKQRDIHKLSARIAWEHHERIDGSGYPRGLTKKEIHRYSQIVAMADVYDALVSPRIYKKAYLPHEAYEYIAGCGNHIFDYDLVQAFLFHLAPYPKGTIVRLSTGQIGIVVDLINKLTIRPIVTILFDNGVPVENRYDLNLAKHLTITIVEIVSEEEYQQLKNKAGIKD